MRRLLLMLCVCLFCLMARCQPVSAAPDVKCTLALGMAQRSPFFENNDFSGAMGELKFRVTGQDVGVFAEVRHAFHDASYLDRKSKIKTGLDFYLTQNATFFAEYERSYHTGDSWGWCGVRFNLARLFGG